MRKPKDQVIFLAFVLLAFTSLSNAFTAMKSSQKWVHLGDINTNTDFHTEDKKQINYVPLSTNHMKRSKNKKRRELQMPPLLSAMGSYVLFAPAGIARAIPPTPMMMEDLFSGLRLLGAAAFIVFITIAFGTTYLESWAFDKDDT